MGYLLKNCAAIIRSADLPVLVDQDILILGPAITAIGPTLTASPLPDRASGRYGPPHGLHPHL